MISNQITRITCDFIVDVIKTIIMLKVYIDGLWHDNFFKRIIVYIYICIYIYIYIYIFNHLFVLFTNCVLILSSVGRPFNVLMATKNIFKGCGIMKILLTLQLL